MIRSMLLILILVSSLAYASQGMGPGPGLGHSPRFENNGFETTIDGWSSPWVRSSAYTSHAGAWVLYNNASISDTTKTVSCRSGNITLWYANGGIPSGNYFQIDSNATILMPSSSSWAQITVAVTAGIHTLKIHSSATSNFIIDDIQIPIP